VPGPFAILGHAKEPALSLPKGPECVRHRKFPQTQWVSFTTRFGRVGIPRRTPHQATRRPTAQNQSAKRTKENSPGWSAPPLRAQPGVNVNYVSPSRRRAAPQSGRQRKRCVTLSRCHHETEAERGRGACIFLCHSEGASPRNRSSHHQSGYPTYPAYPVFGYLGIPRPDAPHNPHLVVLGFHHKLPTRQGGRPPPKTSPQSGRKKIAPGGARRLCARTPGLTPIMFFLLRGARSAAGNRQRKWCVKPRTRKRATKRIKR
jgi:hypothetical protein